MGIIVTMSNVLILKNDRAGDLFTSLNLISTIIRDENNIKIYLSELNSEFNFFFKNIEIKKTRFNLNFVNKFVIFFDILFGNYKKIYILSPKSFYFFLPIIFKKIKFYAIVYDGKKRDRPNLFFRKYLFKYKTVSRRKINKYSYKQLQEQLVDSNVSIDKNCSNLHIPEIKQSIYRLLPQNYIFFQFRYRFFIELKWTKEDIVTFLKFLKKSTGNVVFCSDIENNKISNEYKKFFLENFSYIDLNNNTIDNKENLKNIIYLKDLSGIDMFHITKNSLINVAKEGIISHISFFHKKKSHNLFNFKISNKEDVRHQRIGYSEWCKGMGNSFSFLNSNLNKTIRKVSKFI